MQPWLIIILIVVTCLTILMYTRSSKQSTAEGFGGFYKQQVDYADAQFTRAHEKGQQVIFNQPGAPTSDMKGIINSPDLYLADSPDRDYSKFLVADPTFKYMGNDTLCRGATMPKNLPARVSQQANNCGWWFVSDPATPSVGATGTLHAPLFPNKLPPGGEWIWDIPTAQEKEEIKNCMRITNCDLIEAPGIKGACGFCLSKGYAVPIVSSGEEKYPDSETACGVTPLRNASGCAIPEPAIIEVGGIQCDASLGRPSPDNTLRYFNKDECDQLDGNWYSNGECIVKTGGSYSAACAINNAPAALQAISAKAPTGICTPGADGNLTRACMISLARGLGYNEKGTVLRLLTTTNSPVGNDVVAVKILRDAGVSIPDGIFGQGNLDLQTAMYVYTDMWNTIKKGSTQLIRDAATYLVIGMEEFDVCSFADTDRGPFPTMCIERAFRESGCQPAGSAVPTDDNVGKFSSMTWGAVKGYFANIYNKMKNGDSEIQDNAMTQCLGIKYVRTQPVPCKNPGMERLWYSAQYDNFWAKDCNEKRWGSTYIRYPAFMGRDVNVNGWTQIVSYDNTGVGKARHNFSYMKSRTIINPGDNIINGAFDIWVDDGFRLAINGRETFARWYAQATTHFSVPISIPSNAPNLVEMAFNNGGGAAVLTIGGNVFDRMNIVGQMPFPESAPVIAFDFFRGTDKDRHGTVVSANFDCPISTVGGIQCITTGPNRYIQILTPIRHRVIKTYTWYAKAKRYTDGRARQPNVLCMAEWPQINTFDKNNYIADTQANRAIGEFTGRLNFFMGDGQSDLYVVGQYFRNLWYGLGGVGRSSGDPAGWHHYAVVMHDYGGEMYIDGIRTGGFSNPDLYADKAGSWTVYPDIIMRQIFIGRQADNRFSANQAWRDWVYAPAPPNMNGTDGTANDVTAPECSFAFVHMYDRVLSAEEIKNEMNYMKDPIYNNGPNLSKPNDEIATMDDQYFGKIIGMGWESNTRTRG